MACCVLFGGALGLHHLFTHYSCNLWERTKGLGRGESIKRLIDRTSSTMPLARLRVGVRKTRLPSGGHIAPAPRRVYVSRTIRPSVVRAAAPVAVPAPPAPAAVSTFLGKGALSLLSGKHLEETFMALPFSVALREALILMLLALLLGTFGVRVVHRADEQMKRLLQRLFQSQDFDSMATDTDGGSIDEQKRIEAEANRRRRNVVLGFLDAVSRPLEAIVPIYCWMFAATVALTIGKVSVLSIKIPRNSPQLRYTCDALQNIFSRCIDFIEPWTELVLVVFIAWTLLRLKDKLVRAAGELAQSTDSATLSIDENQVSRLLQPLSQLLSWAIFIGATLSSLIILGVDLGPMLAFGGASTLAIGLAAQSTVSNLVAALSLYTSRAFIKGDRVQFKSMSGSTVVAGMVLDIQPMKTLVKTSNGALIYVNNKDLATSLMVVNESLESRTKLSSSIAEITTEMIVQYKDVDKVAIIVRDIEDYLQTHEDLDSILSRGCHVKCFSDAGVHLLLTGTMAAHARARRRAVYTDVYLSVERIVRQHGAFLSAGYGYDLPPPLEGDA